MAEWPRRAVGSFFKAPRVTTKTLRRRKSAKLRTGETKNKLQVRQRDKVCRFPKCICHYYGLALHVCHLTHKQMGGDPTGERSRPDRMILACIQRHRENLFSIDQGTVEVRPLTPDGTDGPVAWWLRLDDWVELARESKPGVLEPLSLEQLQWVSRLQDQLYRTS